MIGSKPLLLRNPFCGARNHDIPNSQTLNRKTQAYLVKRMMEQGGDGLGIVEELECTEQASKHLFSEMDHDLGEVFRTFLLSN